MNSISDVRTDFFGKDGLVFFTGQVEDVQDPKASGRVRVRCVGWHPDEKVGPNSLATEELPWAHVAMPVTYAQQGRIGGKHSLLPGCWVIGFFFDGSDAQQPIVINTINSTAKTLVENNKEAPSEPGPTLSQADPAFGNFLVGAELFPNSARISPEESKVGEFCSNMDPAGAAFTMDAIMECGDMIPVSSVNRMKEPLSTGNKGNPESQIYDVIFGDGLCGSISSAKQDIQRKLSEKIPSEISRFVFNDAVWNNITGGYIDLNGIMMDVAQEICNLLKQPAQAEKAFMENTVNRLTKATTLAIPDRDGVSTLVLDELTSLKDDLFHSIFSTSFIDVLCQMIMVILQQVNSGGGQGSGQNYTYNVGASSKTDINDWGSECISSTILDTVNVLAKIALQNSTETASKSAENHTSIPSGINSILETLGNSMLYPLTQRFTKYTNIFNSAGNLSMDILNKNMGCLGFRTYATSSGVKSYFSFEKYGELGFGGNTGEPDTSGVPTVCEDAKDPQPKPNGIGSTAIAIPLPSENARCGLNYINGIPNTVVILDPGRNYFYDNPNSIDESYPSIYIAGYEGNPIPVVDPLSGELVSIITNCNLFSSRQPNPSVSIIPDKNWGTSKSNISKRPVSGSGGFTGGGGGIRTDDSNFDIELDGFFIQNMGFNYKNPIIEIYDRDRGSVNGIGNLVVRDGHIVNVELLNNGRGFRRIPKIVIKDSGKGYGAKLYPIMRVVPKPEIKDLLPPEEVIFCPSKNQTNIINGSRQQSK